MEVYTLKNIDEYILYYEYTAVFDLEGMVSMENAYGKNEITLKVGENLKLPFYEEIKSYIANIEEKDSKIIVTLNIPCKPLWENDGEIITIVEGETVKYYYGRTTLNTQTDYYFTFKIKNKN